MSQMTLMTGPERRRRWSQHDRQRILSAAFAPGAVVADVSRQYEVSTSLFTSGAERRWPRSAADRPSRRPCWSMTLSRRPRAPLVAEMEIWMREQRAKLARGHDLARAFDYMLKRWTAFTRFLGDGRVCLSNNAAERALRGVAMGRKSWLFCGSDRGGQRAAVMYSLIVTAKLNDVDPQAWLADVLARIAEHPSQRLDDLLPWNWRPAAVVERVA
jgi:transposase-like protein